MSNISNDNICFNNIFLHLNSLPPNINLLDNFNLIQYRGIVIPRIHLAQNNSKLFEKSEIPQNNKLESNIVNKNKEDFDKSFMNEDNNESNTITKEKNKDYNKTVNNSNFYLKKNNYLFIKNNYYLINKNFNYDENNILLNEKINTQLIPPKSFISIIIDNKEQKDNINKNKNFIFESVNNIILNNLDKLSNDNYINNYNNKILFYKFINNIRNQKLIDLNILNIKTTSYETFDNPKLKKEKFLFTVHSEFNEENNKNHSRRGRKLKNEQRYSRRVHSASDYDNILRKIQVHFLNFITNYANDVIKLFINDKKVPTFKSLDYKIKKTVNYQYFEELKLKPISEILILKISPKMKKHDENENIKVYDTICKRCPYFYGFFQKNYLSLFKEYYYNKRFEVNGREIQLSLRTKTFSDLLKKNIHHKERLIFVANNYFLNNNRSLQNKKPNFKTNIPFTKRSDKIKIKVNMY